MREDIATPPRSSDLPFQVLMSGISYCDGTYIIRRTHSPLTCIEFIVQGEGSVTENEHTFTAKSGDIYILHEGNRHCYYSDEKDPWIKIWMNLSGPAVDHLLYAYGLNLVNHVTGLNLEQDFRQFYQIAGECRTALEVSDRCSLLFHQILQKIAAHVRRAESSSGSVGRSVTAQKIKELIDSTNGFNITLEDIAKQLFFTKTHIIRVFREEYQITPYEYILARKLRLAKDLLINTSLPVSEIAAYLNFCDAHYFTNFFRSRTGKTPREYRKQNAVK